MLSYFNPLAWGRWFCRFLQLWVVTIAWREVPKAMPAIVLLMVLLLTSFVAYTDGGRWRNRLLDRQLKSAWEVDDFAIAELVLRRQLETQPDNAGIAYRLAVARDAQDATDEALRMMRRLVKDQQHELAARWIFQTKYAASRGESLSADQVAERGRLLTLIHRESPDDVRIKGHYAEHLIATERFSAAVPVLSELAEVQPMRGLQAAVIARRLGKETTANRLAQQTLETVAKLSAEEPANAGVSMAVAQCQLFLKRFPEVLKTLDRAIGRSASQADTAKLHQAVGDAIVAWVTFLDRSSGDAAEPLAPSSSEDHEKILQMLQVALRYAPNHPRVLMLVADRVLAAPEGGDERIAARRRALIEGASPGISHFIQGTSALMNQEIESGTMHLEIAAELMPHSAVVLNNLAVALTEHGEGDLEKALALSEKAIEQSDEPNPHFYDTRGQILYRLGRYTRAIADLERALAADALKAQTHRRLAECYAALGEDELSREHAEKGGSGSKRRVATRE